MDAITEPNAALAALAALGSAYRSHGPLTAPDRPIIGTVGQDVPTEIITACGAVPLRLRGDPQADTGPGDHYLGTGLDPSVRSLLSLVLERRFGRLDGIVVSSDCDASVRLFYALREIARVEPGTRVPPVTLVDVLHLPRATTTAYNRVRVRQLVDVVQGWGGTRLTEERLAEAIAAQDRIRGLYRRLSALRHGDPARLSGSGFLEIVGAAGRLHPEEYLTLLTVVAEGNARLPEQRGIRVFLTGSNHDNAAVYHAIEAAGAVIVGEDHDWGELFAARDVSTPTLDALAERYQYNGPTSPRASIRERAFHTARAAAAAGAEVLLSYTREKDEAPLWDFAAQRAAVAIPAAIIPRQCYGQIDGAELEDALHPLKRPEDAA